MTAAFDLLVVGGGINGTAIARAAACAGKRVLLVEGGDLAQGTSSASTKLMHGGLRYLEQLEIKLVRESLRERSIMLRTAPHIVRPLEFRIAPAPGLRRLPILRLGLWLYDLLAAGSTLPRSRRVLIDDPALRAQGRHGLSYWDAWVDDARLVVLNARDAADAGAEIRTRTAFHSAVRGETQWRAHLEGPIGPREIVADCLVNAAGPWVETVLADALGRSLPSRLQLVRGSHIVVRRRLRGEHAWLLQQPDGRIVFAIPYRGDSTLIGTTDAAADSPEDSHMSDAERSYLLAAVNRYLVHPLTAADIVHDYAGIRALFDDGAADPSKVSRDYRLELDSGGAPLLSVFGGKITTARQLAETALRRLGIRGGDTSHRPLPGGDVGDIALFLEEAQHRWPFIDAMLMARLVAGYGTRVAELLGDAATYADLGRDFGGGLTEREVDYLVRREWAQTAEDILWRRTKLGHRLSPAQVGALEAYLEARTA